MPARWRWCGPAGNASGANAPRPRRPQAAGAPRKAPSGRRLRPPLLRRTPNPSAAGAPRAAEVADGEAAEEERQRQAAATAVDQELRLTPTVVEPKPSLEERAAALFREPRTAPEVEPPLPEPGIAVGEPAQPAEAAGPIPQGGPAEGEPRPGVPPR